MKKNKAITKMKEDNYLQFFNKYDHLYYHSVNGVLLKTDNFKKYPGLDIGPDYFDVNINLMPNSGYVKLTKI